jgi:hypothetical protein
MRKALDYLEAATLDKEAEVWKVLKSYIEVEA